MFNERQRLQLEEILEHLRREREDAQADIRRDWKAEDYRRLIEEYKSERKAAKHLGMSRSTLRRRAELD